MAVLPVTQRMLPGALALAQCAATRWLRRERRRCQPLRTKCSDLVDLVGDALVSRGFGLAIVRHQFCKQGVSALLSLPVVLADRELADSWP